MLKITNILIQLSALGPFPLTDEERYELQCMHFMTFDRAMVDGKEELFLIGTYLEADPWRLHHNAEDAVRALRLLNAKRQGKDKMSLIPFKVVQHETSLYDL